MSLDQGKNESLIGRVFQDHEDQMYHRPYSRELSNFGHIKYGDTSEINELTQQFLNNTTSRLSYDPLRCKKYLFVAAITLAVRFAIEGGLNQELAYTLSDQFIQKVDRCRTIEEVGKIYYDMYVEFARRVREVKAKRSYSRKVNEAVDYIYKHLHSRICLSEICKAIGVSQSYFSILFKREVGISCSEYIRKEKASYARDLLEYSDLSYVDISNYLAFSSHSHFISVFKKEYGETPREYRNTHYNSHYTSLYGNSF